MKNNNWDALRKVLDIQKSESFFGGCARVSITTEQMGRIREQNLVDMDHRHNYSPTLGDLYQFTLDHQGKYYFDGYLYPPGRYETTISIDMISGNNLDIDAVIDFANQFHQADEFEVGFESARAWYD